MFKETENWTVKRQISPTGRNRTEKLELMQDNLKQAADTIDALRFERERLKDSLKFALETSNRETSRKNTEEDSEYLRKLLIDRDRKIEKIEEMVNENRLEKNEWKELLENYNKAKSDLEEKEKHIKRLEKKSNDLYPELKSELARRGREIESLNRTLAEINEEKEEWTKLYNVLLELAPDFLRTKSLKDARNKSDWEKFLEIIVNLAKAAETRPDFERGKRFRLEANRVNFSVLNDLRGISDMFIEKVHTYSDWHDCFRHHLVCSKRFKNMIETQEHPEALVRVLRFITDILDSLIPQRNTGKYRKSYFESPHSTRYFYRVHSPEGDQYRQPRKDSPSSSTPKYLTPSSDLNQMQHRGESAFKQTCWTQTSSNKSPLLVSDLNSRSNIGLQTSIDPYGSFIRPRVLNKGVQLENPSFRSQNTIEDQSINFKSSKEKRFGSPYRYKQSETSGNILIDSRISEKTKDEGYLKLYDESQQLLNIIDNQNSRLTKINNQISQLVPNKFDTILEKEEQDSSKLFTKYRNSGPKTIEYENGTFNNPVITSNSNTSEKFRKIARKYTEPQDSYEIEQFRNKERGEMFRSPPKGVPHLERSLESSKQSIRKTKNTGREDVRIEEIQSDESEGSGPGSRDRLESSALRNIKKDRSKNSDSKIESPSRRVSPKGRGGSPDMNADRFNEYSRPILKNEQCWVSVGDYFSAKPEESSSRT